MADIFRRFPSDDLDDSETMTYAEDCAPEWGEARPTHAAPTILGQFFEPASGPSYPGGILKRWTGAAWVRAKLMRWSGSAWVAAALKRWAGTELLQVDTEG